MRTLLVETDPIPAELKEELQRLSSTMETAASNERALAHCREHTVDLLVTAGPVGALRDLCKPLRGIPGCEALGLLALVPEADLHEVLDIDMLDPCDFVTLPVAAEELGVRARVVLRQARTLAGSPRHLHGAVGADQVLAQVEALVELGSWEWLPAKNSVRWSSQLYRIFDLEPESFPATLDGYLDLVHPHDRDRTRATIAHTLETGESFDHVERIVRRSGEIRWLRSRGLADRDDDGKTRRLFGTCQDITDQRMLEQQLIQAQKMESLGRLAGGVAHDFNNLLSVMLTFGGMLASDERASERTKEWADEILKAAERAAGLTRRLLDFSRSRAVSLQPVDVDDVCRGMESMLDRLLADDIELKLDLRASPWTALADAGQLEQVIVNLAVNARDAMPYGGRLRIATAQHAGQPTPAELGLTPGDWIHLRVSDNGSGMDEETLERVFDPFFTTKDRGEGTGLGLAIVHGFAKSHGGAVWAESEKNEGTSVHMWLPKSVLRPPQTPREHTAERFSCPTPGTILLVEDEEQVRRTLRTILERAGCDVAVAEDMEAALDVLRARKADIALLVTDVVMPRGGGRELAERAHQLHPELPVLFISGHPDDDLVVREKLGPDVPFLQKPFTAQDLIAAIARVLGDVPRDVTTE